MNIDGGCHCGQFAFRAEVKPDRVQICHCADCQTLSGSAYRVIAPAKEGTFELMRGELKHYIKKSEDGSDRVQAFCPECGTPIYSSSPDNISGFFGIRVGAIKQKDQLPPKNLYWVRSARHWAQNISELPKSETQ